MRQYTPRPFPAAARRPRPASAVVALSLSALVAVSPACGSRGAPAPAAPEAAQPLAPVGAGFNLNASDLRFVFQQIRRAEHHAAGGVILGTGPDQISNVRLPYGLRTVDGRFNNLVAGQTGFGAADRVFPRIVPASFRPAAAGTSYAQKRGLVIDPAPRTISNLIVDQTLANPAAVEAAGAGAVPDPSGTLFIPNVAPDVGLSAPFNSVFTLFGQFFDHGLDLVTKGGGTVFVPLQPDDPLFVPGSPTNFMVLTRAANQPGPDGVRGDDPATPQDESLDDVQEGTNTTTPFVDQNQTYTSHPAHQVFLRAYRLDALGRPVATGKLLDGAIAGNIGSWSEVKAQAAAMLGLALADADALDVPLLATDPYGRFLRGPNGFALVAFPGGVLVEGNPAAPVSVAGALRTGHAFLDDIAHHAAPVGDHDSTPGTPNQPLLPDADPGFADDGDPATYDDELLGRHFVTGDGRGNENIGLTAIHTVFHAEHNRLADDIHGLVHALLTPAEIAAWEAVDSASGWDYGERLFQASRFVTEMEYQHLVFEEFARKVQPQVNVFVGYHTEIDPAITAEFAHAVYRFGHSMLTETVARVNADGTPNDVPLLAAFLNPLAFNDGGAAGPLAAADAAGSVFQGMALQVGNEIDEFVTEALRNNLLGLPLDLATINMARGRSEGVPTLNQARRRFFALTGNSALSPYQSWADFAVAIRHPASLVNFVAAYGTHPTLTGDLAARRAAAQLIVTGDLVDPVTPPDSLDFLLGTGAWADLGGAPVTGVEAVDLWVGGLAEKQAPFGGLLGSTFNFVFETQLENLQDGDRFYYLTRTAGLNLLVQLEGNSFAELAMRNTSALNLPADAFSRPDLLFDLAFLGTSGPILDDPNTPEIESAMPDLARMPNGTIRYTGPLHVVWAGRDDATLVDRIVSSEGDDTFRGNGGVDVMEGGAGNDNFIGGLGNDILTDAFGDDVLKGGDGNDVLSSGPGFDLNQGGRGDDFIVGGSDPTETFGGPGDDVIFAGDSADTVFGDDGDDWIEGGAQADLLQGDNGAPFQDDPNEPGSDVIIGDGGDDDYDSEGGDDIMVSGPGIERNEGMLGFDWVTHRGDPQPAVADMLLTGLLPPDEDNIRDRFDLVEALSGWRFDDQLGGDDRDAVAQVGHELLPAGVARVAGLQALLGGATSFTGGNIILGGAGSDVIEGRGGNDLVDGDAWLDVNLRVPDLANPGAFRLVPSLTAIRPDVLAGRIDPGTIDIAREITTAGVLPTDVDTAVFRGNRAEYVLTTNPDGTITVDHGGGIDGVDTLRNVELLRFADGTISSAFPVAALSAAALAFPGVQAAGVPSAPLSVVLSNPGAGPLAIASIALGGANPGDFAFASGCGPSLAVNASCTVQVSFVPTAQGARTASLVFTTDAANPQATVALSGTATAIAPTPAALAFSTGLLTPSAPGTVTITNGTAAVVRINSITRNGANPGQFAHTTTCGPFPRNLAAGASCTITATFTPTTDGTKTAALSVNVPAPGVSQTIPLTGTLVPPVFTVTPASLAFDAPIGSTTAARLVTVTNTGPVLVRITGVARGGSNPGQFGHTTTCGPFPANLAPGASCTVSVTFAPTTAGTKSATLAVNVAAPGVSQSVALTGTIVAPVFTVAPGTLGFAPQLRNTTSPARTVTVTNTGIAPLVVSNVTRTGANPGQFAHATTCGPFPRTLAAGASCTISVTFTPTGAGARSASLNVVVAAPGTSQSVPLSGTGL